MLRTLITALIAMTVALLATPANAAVPDRPANVDAARMKNGESAVGGGVTPDPRASAFLNNDFWYEIVLNGAMKDNGMASFKSVLDHQSAGNPRVCDPPRQRRQPPELKGAVSLRSWRSPDFFGLISF